jgi:hypothetical protein
MNDFSEARDIIATLLIVGAAIALMVGLSPIEARPLTIFALLLAAGLGIAKRRILATAAAFGVLGARFLVVFALKRDWRMLAGALVCGGLAYLATKLDPTLLDRADG